VSRLADGGPGGLVLIEGDAGVGKTALLQHAAAVARAAGAMLIVETARGPALGGGAGAGGVGGGAAGGADGGEGGPSSAPPPFSGPFDVWVALLPQLLPRPYLEAPEIIARDAQR